MPGIGAAMALLGGEYWARLMLDPAGTAPWAPLFGAALLLCAECAYLSLEIGEGIAGQLRRRVLPIIGLALTAAAVSELLVLVPVLLPTAGLPVVAAGVVAVAGLLAGLLVLAGEGETPS